jgi:long-subunit fatty acid transport protein
MKKILVLLILTVIMSMDGFCQDDGINKVGTTSFQFLKVMPDARSTAMGEAYTAVACDANAVFWNPSALTKVKGLDVSVSYLDWLLDMNHQSVALAYTFPRIGTIGIVGLITNVGDIEETSVEYLYRDDNTGYYNPGLTGRTVRPSAQVFGLSFARALTDKFSFGINAKYVREDLVNESAAAMVFDGGFTYNTGFRSLQLASAIRHFGPDIQFLDHGESYPLPQTLTIGVSGYLFGPRNAFLARASNHQLLISYDLGEARDYGQQSHLGLEYAMQDVLFLRAGYKFNYDEEGLTLGFGLNILHTRFDFSYADYGPSLNSVYRFSLGFNKN